MFRAFQRWFRIENRSIIKENGPISPSLQYWVPQPMGAPLLRGAPVIGRIRYVEEVPHIVNR